MKTVPLSWRMFLESSRGDVAAGRGYWLFGRPHRGAQGRHDEA